MDTWWQGALLSAAVAVVVAWATASIRVRRARKAERADDARQQILNAVRPYRRRISTLLTGRDPDAYQNPQDGRERGDLHLIRDVLAPTPALAWWRRRIIRRQLIHLFGESRVKIAEVMGDNPDASPTAAMQAVVMGQPVDQPLVAKATEPDSSEWTRRRFLWTLAMVEKAR